MAMSGDKPENMADLLQYFEAQSRSLDREGGHTDQDTTLRDFISLIKFNGVPILPPVLSLSRREEMVAYKREALHKESSNKVRRREKLQARVQSIVAGVEERRAAKMADKLKSPSTDKNKSTAGKPTNKTQATQLVTASSTVSPGSGSNIPVEINITVPSPDISSSNKSTASPLNSMKTSPKPSSQSSPKAKTSNRSNASATGRSRSKFKNLGQLNKAKSYSTQHIETSSSQYSKDSDSSISEKSSLSPHSKGLQPHPPKGRPARRRSPSSSLRQSVSTPDLRTVDFTVEAEDLKKPLPVHNVSPYSGRPEASKPSAELMSQDSSSKPVQKKAVHNEPKSRSSGKKITDPNKDQKPSAKVSRNDSNKHAVKSSDKLVNKPADKHRSQDVKDTDTLVKKGYDRVLKPDLNKASRKESDMLIKKEYDTVGRTEQDIHDQKGTEAHIKADSQKRTKQVSENPNPKESVKKPEKVVMKEKPKQPDRQDKNKSNSMDREMQHDDISPLVLCNPLEQLEREIERVEKAERAMNLQHNAEPPTNVRADLDPIQTATAELFPFPLSEEQALATLDSLPSDFASLEQGDSLPQDYNGIPLTSMKQQQIIHMLTKLSKALNIEDTLTSTTGSSGSGNTVHDMKLEPVKVQSSQYDDARSGITQTGATGWGNPGVDDSERSYENADNSEISNATVEGDDTLETGVDLSPNVTSDSNTTGQSSASVLSSAGTSASSNYSRNRMNPTDLSILSSASSVSGSRVRISPKSLKNTVHFSSFITEISTSASQSIEDKISVRKLDITPASSQNFENTNDSLKNLPSSGPTLQQPSSLLSNVSLSPSVDSSQSSPGEFIQRGFPFDSSHHENELNTSDKENEFVSQHDDSSDSNDFDNHIRSNSSKTQQVLNVFTANIPPGPIGDNHPLLVKASVKSDNSESSTLKGSQDKMSSQENIENYNRTMDTQYYYGTASTDLGKYMNGTTIDSNAGTMQDQITKSYLLSRNHSSEQATHSTEDKFEIKKPTRNTSLLDESAILLKPVIYSHKSKPNNTEIQEDKKPSNLQKVQLEDPDESESSDEEAECVSEQPINNVPSKEDEEESCEEEVEQELPEPIKSGEVAEEEEEGKAEHIQKYLSQVHEQSLQNEQDFKLTEQMDNMGVNGNVLDNIGSSINCFMSSIQHMNHLSQEDLFHLQAEQFEQLQQQLIEQQQSQLEELFVQQRREQMKLQSEIEDYHQTIKSQDDIETVMLQESLRSQLTSSQPQVMQAWPDQYHFQAPVHGLQPPEMPFQPPVAPQMHVSEADISAISHQDSTYSTLPPQDPPHRQDPPHSNMYGGPAPRQSGNPNLNRSSNPYTYVSSPGLYAKQDRDNVSDVSSFAKGSPKQLVFSNQSTPVPKVYKPVIRSPVKQPSYNRPTGRVSVPEQVLDPRMRPMFDRVSATVKGYLTRKLLMTPKVQEILKTISDTRNFAFSFQAETPIKKGTYTRADTDLLERIVAQLQAALLDIHEIFFNIPMSERMGLIAQARQLQDSKQLRESQRSSMDMSRLHPRVSSATLKAMDRKRRAQLAEEAVFGSTEFRPKSAPPATSSPHPSTEIRALKPLQGQISPIRPDSQVSVREVKEHRKRKTAHDKTKSDSAGSKPRKTASSNKVTKTASKSATANTNMNRTTATAKSRKQEKAWR